MFASSAEPRRRKMREPPAGLTPLPPAHVRRRGGAAPARKPSSPCGAPSGRESPRRRRQDTMAPVVLPAPARTPPAEVQTDQVDFDALVQWARRRDPVRWALAAIIVVWSVIFIRLGWLRHSRFGTFGFDLGIYDQ